MLNTNRGWVFVAAKCQGRGAIPLAKWVDKLEDFLVFVDENLATWHCTFYVFLVLGDWKFMW